MALNHYQGTGVLDEKSLSFDLNLSINYDKIIFYGITEYYTRP